MYVREQTGTDARRMDVDDGSFLFLSLFLFFPKDPSKYIHIYRYMHMCVFLLYLLIPLHGACPTRIYTAALPHDGYHMSKRRMVRGKGQCRTACPRYSPRTETDAKAAMDYTTMQFVCVVSGTGSSCPVRAQVRWCNQI